MANRYNICDFNSPIKTKRTTHPPSNCLPKLLGGASFNGSSWNDFQKSLTETELQEQAYFAQSIVQRASAFAKSTNDFPMSVEVFYEVLGKDHYGRILETSKSWLWTDGKWTYRGPSIKGKCKTYTIINDDIFQRLLAHQGISKRCNKLKWKFINKSKRNLAALRRKVDKNTKTQIGNLEKAFELIKENLNLIDDENLRSQVENQMGYGFWITATHGRLYSAFHSVPSEPRNLIMNALGYNSVDLRSANLFFLGALTDSPEWIHWTTNEDPYLLLGTHISNLLFSNSTPTPIPHDISEKLRIPKENRGEMNTRDVREVGKLACQYFINSTGDVSSLVANILRTEFRFISFVGKVEELKRSERNGDRKGAWHPCQQQEDMLFRKDLFGALIGMGITDYVDMHDGYYSKHTYDEFKAALTTIARRWGNITTQNFKWNGANDGQQQAKTETRERNAEPLPAASGGGCGRSDNGNGVSLRENVVIAGRFDRRRLIDVGSILNECRIEGTNENEEADCWGS